MKKLFLSLSAALLVLAACQEEIAPVTDNTTDEVILKDYPVEMSFTATTEMGTKTTLSGTTVAWEAGDQIKVLWESGSNVAETEEGGTKADFSTRVDDGVTEFWAAYPYSESTVLEGGNLVVTIPSEQNGVFAGANYAVAKTIGSSLEFKHLVGLVEVSTSLENASRITIKGAENDVLAGVITVSGFDAETGLPEYEVAEGAKEIVLNVSGAGTYYAALIPTAQMKCLSVCVETKDGETATSEYALSPNALKMERAKIVGLGNVDSRLGKNYFVSSAATGSGDGKTWETAFTYQQMADFVAARNANGPSAPEGGTNTAVDAAGDPYLAWHNGVRAAELDGATFHIAKGTYSSSAYLRISFPGRGSAVKMTFLGGYPENAKGTDLSGRDPETNVTTISGQEKRRLFFVRYYSDITFDGIVLADGWVNTNGGALLFNESKTSSVTFNNCDFVNNRAIEHATEGNKIGGAINASSTEEKGGVGSLTFTKCNFEGNHATKSGGVIYAVGGTHVYTECIFQSNSTGAGDGGVLYSTNASTKHVFTDCVFYGNNAVGAGGVINASASEIKLEDCVVGGSGENQPNSCTGNGGAFQFSGAKVDIVNSIVSKNSTGANVGGAIYSNGALSMNLIDTDFIGNTAGKSGGTLYHSGTGTITIKKQNKEKVYIKDSSCGLQYGGAIYISAASTWNISDCHIINNGNTGASTTENPSFGSGGAFYICGEAKVNITGGEISNNEASTNGAGISVRSKAPTVILNGVQMNSNSAVRGAAIDFERGTWTLTGCQFKNNVSSTGLGGAIYANTGSMSIENGCLFESNETTKNSGGAIYVTANASVSIKDSKFLNNKALKDSAYGGAVYISNSASKVTKISNCFFKDNKAEFGSAINAHANYDAGNATYTTATLYINGCTFTGEASTGYTSALNNGVVYTKGQLYMNNCMFYDNIFTKNNNSLVLNAASGGSESQAIVVNTTVIENSDNMGALIAYYDNVNTELYNNVFISKSFALNGGYETLKGALNLNGYNYYTGSSLLNGSTLNKVDSDSDVTYSDVIGNFTLTDNADGKNWYTWTAPADLGKTTKADVETFLNGVTGGADFLTWLNTVNGLTKDIAGNERPATGWYPGCYQGK